MHIPRSRLTARSVLSLTLWMAFSATFFLAQAQGPVIRVESKTVAPGEVAVINITVSNLPSPGVNDVQGTLRYDPNVMQVQSLTALSGFTLFAFNNAPGEATFAIAIVGGTPVRQGGLVQFEVKAVGEAGQQTTLELELQVFRDPDGNELFPPEDLPSLIQQGTFKISGGGLFPSPPMGEVSVHVFPNPARTKATFVYELPEGTTQATLWVFALRGELVFRQTLDVQEGRYEWNLKDNAGRAVPSGAYYFRISALTPQGTAHSPVGKLVIRR